LLFLVLFFQLCAIATAEEGSFNKDIEQETFEALLEEGKEEENSFLLSGRKPRSPKFRVQCFKPNSIELVDWYFIFLMTDDYNKYVYIDNTMQEPIVLDLDFDKGELAKSFPPLKAAKNLNYRYNNYIVWNDDEISDDSQSFSRIAHSKGFLGYDRDGAAFIIHSLPRFPWVGEDMKFVAEFPSNQGVYAQTFACVSLNQENLHKVLQIMYHYRPGIQKVNTRNNIDDKAKELIGKLTYRRRTTKKEKANASIRQHKIHSALGQELLLFTKPHYFYELPWDRHIPEYFEEDFFVGTWTRPNLLPNICDNEYKTINMVSYNFYGMEFKNSNDHSKWAFSNSVLCVGDLNRTESQYKRAGSVICMRNPVVSSAAQNYATGFEDCNVSEPGNLRR